jgi:hypothetical protein
MTLPPQPFADLDKHIAYQEENQDYDSKTYISHFEVTPLDEKAA